MICYDTLVWTSENIGAYGEDSKDISVCGDSSGDYIYCQAWAFILWMPAFFYKFLMVGDRLAFSVLVRYNTMQVKVQATGQAK